MRIALFITCFNDTVFPGTGRAVVSVLERLGHRAEFPQEQTCFGQMHFNTGYRPDAMPLVARFARAFAGYDAVVTPSASCATTPCWPRSTGARRFSSRSPNSCPACTSSPSS